MARNTKKNSNTNDDISSNKLFKRQLTDINNLIGRANLSLYGSDRTSDVDNLNAKFQDLLNEQIGD